MGHGAPAAFREGAVVHAAGGMRFNLIGRAVHNVNPAPVGHPTRKPAGEALVGVRNPTIVLFLVLVFHRARGGVAAQPELLNELLPFLVGVQVLEGIPLFRRDNVNHVLFQPLLEVTFQLLLDGFFAPFQLFFFRLALGQAFGERRLFLAVLVLLVLLAGKGNRKSQSSNQQDEEPIGAWWSGFPVRGGFRH